MSAAPEVPKSTSIYLRRMHDDLVVWSVKMPVDVGDRESLERLSAKAGQCVKALEHTMFTKGVIATGEKDKTIPCDPTRTYLDDTDIARAMASVRDYFKWLKEEDARKPRLVIAGPSSFPPPA